jgi:hypothetical protein
MGFDVDMTRRVRMTEKEKVTEVVQTKDGILAALCLH